MEKVEKKTAIKPRAVNVRNPEKYEYAYLLFMQKCTQIDICEKVAITPATLLSWKKSGGWEEKRAARTISIDTLISKTLQKINDLLDNADGFNADSFSKAVNQLKNLKSGVTIDDKILAYLAFTDWMSAEAAHDKEIDELLIKRVNALQDRYILQMLRDNG